MLTKRLCLWYKRGESLLNIWLLVKTYDSGAWSGTHAGTIHLRLSIWPVIWDLALRLGTLPLFVIVVVFQPLVFHILRTFKKRMLKHILHCYALGWRLHCALFDQIVEFFWSISANEVFISRPGDRIKKRLLFFKLVERWMPHSSFIHEAAERPDINLFWVNIYVKHFRRYPLGSSNLRLSVGLTFG